MIITKSNKFAFDRPNKCNCGGYALGLEKWYTPYEEPAVYRERAIRRMLREGMTKEEVEKEILARDTEFMIKNFGGALTTIENPNTIPDSETVIAYRICVDENFEGVYTDYHFKVRNNGVWSHKQGSMVPEECELEENEPWGLLEDDDETILHYYDSPIQYFLYEEKI